MSELIHKCQAMLAKKHGVNLDALVYIGSSDCSWREPGAVSVNFNLIQEGHKHHKSTVAINSWNL